MKQSAVEWLNDEIIGLDVEFNMTLISRENYWIKRKELLEQAKEMEKQQIIDFAFDTYYYISGIMKVPFNQVSENKIHAEDKYNETFKK